MTNGATTTENPQTSFEEEPLTDAAIVDAIEHVQKAKADIGSARDDLKDADKVLQALVSQKELPDGTYRAGVWVVKVSHVAAHKRLAIKLAKTAAK